MEEAERKEIKNLVKSKIKEWYETVEETRLSDLRVNVFLASAMGIKDPRDLIAFYANQHFERSIVTSFGYLIQDIATIVGRCKKVKIEGADVIKTKGGEDYYIEIKSGTASSNVKMMRETSRKQKKIKDKYPGAVTALGLTYGKPDEVFSTMTGYYKGDRMLVGKNFWKFLSGEEDTHKEVLEAIEEAKNEAMKEIQITLDSYQEGRKKTLYETLTQKTEELIDEWIKKYGDSLEFRGILKRLF